MPLLPDAKNAANIKQFYLPVPSKDSDGKDLPLDQRSWVKMDVCPVNGRDFLNWNQGASDAYGRWLTSRILEWNFVDETGVPIPITYENVSRLGVENLRYLSTLPLDKVTELTDDQKKTSIATSTQ